MVAMAIAHAGRRHDLPHIAPSLSPGCPMGSLSSFRAGGAPGRFAVASLPERPSLSRSRRARTARTLRGPSAVNILCGDSCPRCSFRQSALLCCGHTQSQQREG